MGLGVGHAWIFVNFPLVAYPKLREGIFPAAMSIRMSSGYHLGWTS
jgi:hypothetical protein